MAQRQEWRSIRVPAGDRQASRGTSGSRSTTSGQRLSGEIGMNTNPKNQSQSLIKRPRSVLFIGVLFIAIGLLDIWRGTITLRNAPVHLTADDLTVLTVGASALLGSILMLIGYGWARWLLTAWMALHVALWIRHPYVLLAHVAIFGLVLVGLFRPAATAYFRRSDE